MRVASANRFGNCLEGMGSKRLQVLVCSEGCLYIDKLLALMEGGKDGQEGEEGNGGGGGGGVGGRGRGVMGEGVEVGVGVDENDERGDGDGQEVVLTGGSQHDPLYNPPPLPDKDLEDWNESLLLLVPLRLGVQSIDGRYRKNIAELFSMKQCLGIMGGTPRHAIYFYGCSTDGGTLFGKDPHHTQMTPRRVRGKSRQQQDEVVLSKEYRDSAHGASVKTMIERVDPSLALAFYCKGRSQFNSLIKDLREGICSDGTDIDGGKRLFSLMDHEPDYAGNITAINDMNNDDMSDSEDEWHFV